MEGYQRQLAARSAGLAGGQSGYLSGSQGIGHQNVGIFQSLSYAEQMRLQSSFVAHATRQFNICTPENQSEKTIIDQLQADTDKWLEGINI